MSEAQRPGDVDPEVQRDLEVATEHATHFKRVLDGMRIYPKGHKTLAGYEAGLFDRLTTALALEHDELALTVTPLGFSVHGTILNKADRLGDSITHPLYLDGVKRLSITRGLTAAELTRFMQLWRDTLDEQLGDTHTFSTRVWEEDFDSFEIVSLDTFGDGVKGPDGRTGKERLQSAIDTLAGKADGLGGGGGPGGPQKLRRLPHVTQEDARQLKARGIPQLTEQDLQRMASGERVKPPGLTPAELAALSKELLGQHDRVVERVFDALFLISTGSTAAEQESLANALAIVMNAMVRAGRIDHLRDNLMRQVSEARKGDPLAADARLQTLARLMTALRRSDVLGPLIAALDDEAQRAAALTVLKFLPAKSELALLDWLWAPELPEARKALADVLATMKPDPNELAARVGWSDAELAIELIRISQAHGPAGWVVRKAALAHAIVAVQVAAVKGIDKATIAAHRLELVPLLSSPVNEIRETLFSTLVASGDKAVAPALCTLLRRQKLDETERRRVVIALGTLGGPEASATLRHVFEHDASVELKCTAAGALANMGDEKARPLLKAAAGKLLFGGPLKKAAQEALKRLDATQKATPA
ncbi:MAG: HEAT repeat domain-containing protein [Archangiaceae bacterium]|nr:HEAT repeat domain-containing protein [Archangiaceae bacterium]